MMRSFCCLCCILLLAVTGLSQQPRSLDDQLLDDVPPSKNVTPKPLPPINPAPNKVPVTPAPEQLAPTRPSPLQPIAGKMELLERRLISGFNDEITSLQNEIVQDMEKLLQGCCKPGANKTSTSSSSGTPDQKQPGNNQNQANTNKPEQSQTNSLPGDGTKSSGNGTGVGPGSANTVTAQQLLEKTWGNLPARERERVLEAAGEGFVSEYERSTKQYFQRLFEESRQPR
jgi:hypothetical protein